MVQVGLSYEEGKVKLGIRSEEWRVRSEELKNREKMKNLYAWGIDFGKKILYLCREFQL